MITGLATRARSVHLALLAVAATAAPLLAATRSHEINAVPVDDVAPARFAPVRVVVTLPVYGAITSAIGGTEVAVTSIADAREDAHFVRPKPSFAAELRRADLFVTTGLDLELWVPALLDRAGNARVTEGGPGYVTTYTGVKLLEVPVNADRSAGDIHIYGNPHIYTDPLNAIQIARNIVIGLKRVAPERAAQWDRGLAAFTQELYNRLYGEELVRIVGGAALADLSRAGRLHSFITTNQLEGRPLADRLGGWLKQAERLRDREVICEHRNWAYFEDRFGIACADYLEPKPGIPPTPGHVARLIQTMRSRDIDVILAANYFGRDKVETVAERAGARAAMVPFQTGDGADVNTYFDLVDRWVATLVAAL
jgi:ABC-type Zn uptake system ZnuABC Zn-binding protein ZnuA